MSNPFDDSPSFFNDGDEKNETVSSKLKPSSSKISLFTKNTPSAEEVRKQESAAPLTQSVEPKQPPSSFTRPPPSNASHAARRADLFSRSALTNSSTHQESPTGAYDEQAQMADLQLRAKHIQGQSVASSRRAMAQLAETTQVADKTLLQLHDQTEQLARAERDAAKAQVAVADAKLASRELKKYNSMFAFSMPRFLSSSRRRDEKQVKEAEKALAAATIATAGGAAAAAGVQDKKEKDKEQRTGMPLLIHRLVAQRSATASTLAVDEALQSSEASLETETVTTTPLIQDPEEMSHEDCEAEISQNLNQMSTYLSGLKLRAEAMNTTLDINKAQIHRLQESSERVQAGLLDTQRSLKRF